MHQANNYEDHLINEEHIVDKTNSIFELISENIISKYDEMTNQ